MKFYTTKEIAEMFGVSLITVQKWVESGKFPNTKKFGRDWAIPKSDLLKFKKPNRGRPLRRP